MDKSQQKNSAGKTFEPITDKRLKKIAQLKAQLQKEEALLNQTLRKERNGQLVALGVLVELIYKAADEATKKQWQNDAHAYLKDRNLDRVLAAFERLKN